MVGQVQQWWGAVTGGGGDKGSRIDHKEKGVGLLSCALTWLARSRRGIMEAPPDRPNNRVASCTAQDRQDRTVQVRTDTQTT